MIWTDFALGVRVGVRVSATSGQNTPSICEKEFSVYTAYAAPALVYKRKRTPWLGVLACTGVCGAYACVCLRTSGENTPSLCTVALTLVWYSISVPALARVYALTH